MAVVGRIASDDAQCLLRARFSDISGAERSPHQIFPICMVALLLMWSRFAIWVWVRGARLVKLYHVVPDGHEKLRGSWHSVAVATLRAALLKPEQFRCSCSRGFACEACLNLQGVQLCSATVSNYVTGYYFAAERWQCQ